MVVLVNGEEREVRDDTTVAELVDALGGQLGAVAIELNRVVVPRGGYATRVLRDGDVVEVVHFVGGG